MNDPPDSAPATSADPIPPEPPSVESFEPVSAEIVESQRESHPLDYAPRPERVMIERIDPDDLVGPGGSSWSFFLGMMAAFVFGYLAFAIPGGSFALFSVLLITPPLVMLGWRTTRMVGAGWLTSVALTGLTVMAICGDHKWS
ncbi:hypothetical protein [Humisphaera borealis]|uniref:Uncharacterized protein n=1 Tax=Humisphaera borealis TaxID=2807512 RepID=A0A7M2X1T9_9BACT|nr:hypothetical protein [Humisphaera borealis]QOV91559.1 hypothetical protein IPV69_09445 [Humisphaera borealis]